VAIIALIVAGLGLILAAIALGAGRRSRGPRELT
jgi:hypothetical protein